MSRKDEVAGRKPAIHGGVGLLLFLLNKWIREPNSWRVCNIKLAQDWLEKRAETMLLRSIRQHFC
jgi:hypothetical protein